MNGQPDLARLRSLVTALVLGPDLERASFAGPQRGQASSPWVRVLIRPVELRGQRHLQFSYYDDRKHIARNTQGQASADRLQEVLASGFAGIHIATRGEELDIRTTKKGKILVGRRLVETGRPGLQPHNRLKDLPLPEGRANRLLEVMGILTRGGQVRPTRRAKFNQINEFLKQLKHVLDDAQLASLGRPVEILDCGCGASYLTLAVHHYLNDVLKIPARIQGVDVNEEVIRKSIERSERLGAGLRFSCGPIDQVADQADIVLALHACDTATDDAIAQAIRSQARVLLSVPCCHHHLNEQLRAQGPAEVLRPLLRHGLLQQRAADLLTDTFRALALRILGYRTDVVEFISSEHTSRNLMIRAVRGLAAGGRTFVQEYLALRAFCGVTPYIEAALGEAFQSLLRS